jgi:Leucine-rich repeat (LRR) protein
MGQKQSKTCLVKYFLNHTGTALTSHASLERAPRTRVERSTKTGVLTLTNSNLKELPKKFITDAPVDTIRSLDLSFNKFSMIPSEIGLFTSLKILNFGNNGLTVLPKELFKLAKLENLQVGARASFQLNLV